MENREYLLAIWNQNNTPILFLSGKKEDKLRVKIPMSFAQASEWLKGDNRINPVWKDHHWHIPKAWGREVFEKALLHWGHVYLIQPVKLHRNCDRKCWNAGRLFCECSCMGRNHGKGESGSLWYAAENAQVAESKGVTYGCTLYGIL